MSEIPDCQSASSVVVKNHSSIWYVGGSEGGIGQLLIENCPALEYIGGSMYGRAEWSVTNCENLKYFTVHDSDFGSLAFSGCPQLVLDFREAGNRVGSLLLDADAVLTEKREQAVSGSETVWLVGRVNAV